MMTGRGLSVGKMSFGTVDVAIERLVVRRKNCNRKDQATEARRCCPHHPS